MFVCKIYVHLTKAFSITQPFTRKMTDSHLRVGLIYIKIEAGYDMLLKSHRNDYNLLFGVIKQAF